MYSYEKKNIRRQMHSNDSEEGKKKLLLIKENLYETTTKVIAHSIEMYTKKELKEWVQTDLLDKLDETNKDIRAEVVELEQGRINMFDITNGCVVINNFVRRDSLKAARDEINKRIQKIETEISDLKERQELIEKRRQELEKESDRNELAITYVQNTEEEQPLLTEREKLVLKISKVQSLDDLLEYSEEIENQKSEMERAYKELIALTKAGGDKLGQQDTEEREKLENLRYIRNKQYAHSVGDETDISIIGSWEPEGGPLYEWAAKILDYIKIIEKRYKCYELFDDYYKNQKGKEKFIGCKVFVQQQINELYVNRSNVVFEFAGNLYDKEHGELNFKKLIENMAVNWDTGISYLTVVTNEDLPEMNLFFKQCLSGTTKYVNSYLVDRNKLREVYRENGAKDADYVYFKFLYHLDSSQENIYWKGRCFSPQEFAVKIMCKYIRVKNEYQLETRLSEYETYLDGIDIKKWCEHHLLSEAYYASKDDLTGRELARKMEDSIIDFCNNSEKGRKVRFKKAIKTSANLFFYMGQDYLFSYTCKGQTVNWRTLKEACDYLEDAGKFVSYNRLATFVDGLHESEYFRIWVNLLMNAREKSEV